MKLSAVKIFALMSTAMAFVGCTTSTGQPFIVNKTTQSDLAVSSTASDYDTSFLEGNPFSVWDKLHHTSIAKLAELQRKTDDPIKSAWIQLAVISKQKNISTQQLTTELMTWREKYLDHPANSLFPENEILGKIQESISPKQIAILLPESGAYSSFGQIVKEGFLNAYYNDNGKQNDQKIKFYDTAMNKDINALYQQAVNEGADFVVGPLLKPQVAQLNNARNISIPVLALNYTDGNLANNLYEFGLLPEDEATQLADRATENNRSHALVIVPKNTWGERMVTAFTKRWENNGGSIQDTWQYVPKEREKYNDQIAKLLKINPETDELLNKDDENGGMLSQQRRQDFDVVILFAQPQDARIIVPLLRYYYVNNIPVYATSAVYSGTPNPIKDVDLNGIIVCDIPWKLQANQTTTPPSHDRLFAVGQDAYKLTQSINRITRINNFPLYGTTGSLMMSADQKIHRRLPCLTVHNGLL